MAAGRVFHWCKEAAALRVLQLPDLEEEKRMARSFENRREVAWTLCGRMRPTRTCTTLCWGILVLGMGVSFLEKARLFLAVRKQHENRRQLGGSEA